MEFQSYGASSAISCMTQMNAPNLAKEDSTQFTYPRGMKG